MSITNLKNLFNAQQQLAAYNAYTSKKDTSKNNKNLADANGDGKVNTTDKTKIENEIKNNSTTSKLYDMNGDKTVDAKDFVAFSTSQDLDGNKKVSAEEKSFLQAQKINLAEYLVAANGIQFSRTENKDGVTTKFLYEGAVLKEKVVTKKDGTGSEHYTYEKGVLSKAKIIESDGKITDVVYDSTGKRQQAIITETDGTKSILDYVNGQKVSKEKTTYDAKGNVTSKLQYFYNDEGTAIASSKLTYQYDNNGKIKSTKQYTYDKDGKNSKIISQDTYKYADDGNLSSITTTAYKNGDTSKIAAKVENQYTFNRDSFPTVTATENGIVIKFDKNSDGEFPTITLNNGQTAVMPDHRIDVTDGKNVISYDANGKITSCKIDKNSKKTKADYSSVVVKNTNKVVSSYSYDKNNVKTGEILKEYDKNGKLVKTTAIVYKQGVIQSKVVSDVNGINERHTYNDKGKEIKLETLNSHGESRVIKTTYQSDGKTKDTSTEEHYMAGGFLRLTRTFGYTNNKKSSEVRETYHMGTNKLYKRTDYGFDANGKKTDEIVYTYNTNGKLAHVKYYDRDANGKVTKSVKMKLDSNGKVTAYEEVFYKDGVPNNMVVIEYNSNGKIKSTNWYVPNSKGDATTTKSKAVANYKQKFTSLEALKAMIKLK